MEHPPRSSDLAPNGFWLFQKIKSALKGQRFQDTEDVEKCDDVNESYFALGVPKMFATVST
jgi:hypothetical protein